MKAFTYNGRKYLRLVPTKPLFRSTMVHEVVNRGDVFAMDLDTQALTIIPGTASVEHFTVEVHVVLDPVQEAKAVSSTLDKEEALQRLRAIRDLMNSGASLQRAIAAIKKIQGDV